MSLNEHSETKQLEIIGSEFGPKISSNTTNHQLSIKNTDSSISPRFKSSKIDQNMLQIPKRATFLAGRKTQGNVLSRYRILI